MTARTVIGFVLLLASALAVAEPPHRNTPKKAPAVTPPGATSPAPLKLHTGDVRKYMTPEQYAAAIGAPDAERDTVVVQGTRDTLPPLKSMQPVPAGLAAPFWAVAHPASAWRVFLPDPNAPEPGRPDVVPKPEFHRGP